MMRINTLFSWTRVATALFPVVIILLPAGAVSAADATPLFSDHSLIEATISAPYGTIMRERSEENEYPGTFNYIDSSGQEQTFDIQVRIRGKYRAQKDICDFGPLRLNFKKKQVAGTEFDRQDKIKLVTHCENAGRVYEQHVLREYLSYRFLMLLTDNSFRARLLRVTYVDSEGDSRTRTKYAFLIEHHSDLAKRIEMDRLKVPSIEFDQLHRDSTNLFAVFSYFIGNTDFSAVAGPLDEHCCHNAYLFEHDSGQYVPVPYDFDLSGMVDAPYATPNPLYNIRDVTVRVYRGLCRNNELLSDTLDLFHSRRDDFYAVINDVDGLTGTHRKKVTKYVDRFYDVLESDKKIQGEFIKECSDQ